MLGFRFTDSTSGQQIPAELHLFVQYRCTLAREKYMQMPPKVWLNLLPEDRGR